MPRRFKALAVLIPALTVGLLALPTVAGAATKTPAKVPASFSFSGAGWGHGVGMSQYGAKGQAASGRSATQILQHYYTGARVGAFRDDVPLRVNLAYRTTSVRMRVEPLGRAKPVLQVSIGDAVLKAAVGQVVDLGIRGSTMVVRVDGAVKASGPSATIRWSGTRAPGATGTAPAVLNLVSGRTSLDTTRHRYRYGHVEVRARYSSAVGATAMSAVNVLRLHDEYVFGVGEMPSSWPAAALQAQAIASRGYALAKYRQGMRGGCWCHVFDDTSDQVFVGWSKQAGPSGERWTAAVKATNLSPTTSKTVLIGKVPAQTFFFSSTGGRTQNSEDVWSSKVSYLRSVDDRWSVDPKNNPSNAVWGPRVRTQQQVAAAFGLADVARIDLTDRYASGAVRLAKAWSAKGTYAELAGARLVGRLGLTSRWFRPTGSPAAAPSPTSFSVFATGVQIKAGTVGRVVGSVSPVRPAVGSTVSLRRWDSAKKVLVNAGRAKVARSGEFAFSIKGRTPQVSTYVVYQPPIKCGRKCVIKGAQSKPFNVAVVSGYRVAAGVPRSIVAFGAQLPVSGWVGPAQVAAGATVSIQRLDPARGWVQAAKVRLDRSGRFNVALTGLAAGRHQLVAVKDSDRCLGSVCAMEAGRSTVIPVTVQRQFGVTVSAFSKARRAITVKGVVSPVEASAGGRVVIQRRIAGEWIYKGVARVGPDGRFTTTLTGQPLRPVTLRVLMPAASCIDGVCANPSVRSRLVVVTPRSR